MKSYDHRILTILICLAKTFFLKTLMMQELFLHVPRFVFVKGAKNFQAIILALGEFVFGVRRKKVFLNNLNSFFCMATYLNSNAQNMSNTSKSI